MNRIPMLLLLVLAAASLTAGGSHATTSRIQALGGHGAYFEDEANVGRWFGSLVDYPNLAVFESGGFNLQQGYKSEDLALVSGPRAGIHYGFGENGRWGTAAVYVRGGNRDTPFAGSEYGQLDQSFSALYARTFGPVSAGLFISHGSAAQKIMLGYSYAVMESVIYRQESKETDFGIGARVDLSERAYLDLAAGFRRTEIEFGIKAGDLVYVESEENSSGNYELRGRLFYELGENTALVPVLELIRTDSPIPSHHIQYSESIDNRFTRAGCALNYFPDPDRFLMASVEYRGGRAEFSTRYGDELVFGQRWDWDSFVAGIGAETRLLAWLSLRAAVDYEYRWIESSWSRPENVEGAPENGAQEFLVLRQSLGAALHLGRWDLDVALSEDVPQAPAGFTGYEEVIDRWHWLTVTLRAGF